MILKKNIYISSLTCLNLLNVRVQYFVNGVLSATDCCQHTHSLEEPTGEIKLGKTGTVTNYFKLLIRNKNQ